VPVTEWTLFMKRLSGSGLGFRELVRGQMAEFGIGTTDPDFADSGILPEIPDLSDPSKDEVVSSSKPKVPPRGVHMRIVLPGSYPSVSPKVTVLSQHPIRPYLQSQIDNFLKANTGNKVLRNLVKWIDRMIGAWPSDPSFVQEKAMLASDTFDEEKNAKVHVSSPSDEQQEQQPLSKEEGDSTESSAAISNVEDEGQGEGRKHHKDQTFLSATVPNEPCGSVVDARASDTDADADTEADAEAEAESSVGASANETEDEAPKWTFLEQTLLEVALMQFPATMERHKRWRLVSKAVPSKTKKQCFARYKAVRAKQYGDKTANETPRPSTSLHQPWSEEEQLALDNSLARFPPSMDKHIRWAKIAKAVGRGKRECIVRFREVRNHLLAVKSISEQVESDTLPDLSPDERGLRIEFTDLELRGIGWAVADMLALDCSCEQCGVRQVVEIIRGEKKSLQCSSPTCKADGEIMFHASLVHGASSTAGFADVQNFHLDDVVSVSVTLGCFECSAGSPLQKATRTRAWHTNCRSCHSKLHFQYEGWVMTDMAKLRAEARLRKALAKASQTAKAKVDARVTPGQPLPQHGTCEHEPETHKWLRFPCCDRLFQCTICHTARSGCSAPKRPHRQVCGFCSSEMPFSQNNPCSSCAKPIAAPKQSRHWEGGKGCRDQHLMSSKDSRKYANSRLKTKSRRSRRMEKK